MMPEASNVNNRGWNRRMAVEPVAEHDKTKLSALKGRHKTRDVTSEERQSVFSFTLSGLSAAIVIFPQLTLGVIHILSLRDNAPSELVAPPVLSAAMYKFMKILRGCLTRPPS